MKLLFSFQLALFTFLLTPLFTSCQSSKLQVTLEPLTISEVGGLQSFSFGQYDGKWLILGGRLDGLHMRQPFASFSADGNNTNIIVIDPVSNKSWKKSNQTLPSNLREQLSSTNMEFIQEGEVLYLIGGYAYSPTNADHITFSYLTAVDLPGLIDAVINDESLETHFRQVEDDQFAVTGGYLGKINDTYYLVGGQKFIGRYNPMGPNHGPGFFQQYTNEIRRFTIDDDGTDLKIDFLPVIHDEMHLHKRDYNLLPMMFDNEEEGLIAYSGVFQTSADIPWLYPVVISENGYQAIEEFSQLYNHYHCASASFYSEKNQESTAIFFGGIAQFYEDNGVLVQDNDVPFVKTIASVTRKNDGTFTEEKLAVEMPDYLGASAEFIPLESISKYPNDVIKLDEIGDNPELIGYIYGGINSDEANVFWINTGIESSANNVIYKVNLTKEKTSSAENLSLNKDISMQLYPNPASNILRMVVEMPFQANIDISIENLGGGKVYKHQIEKNEVAIGTNYFNINLNDIISGNYLVTLNANKKRVVQKLIVND